MYYSGSYFSHPILCLACVCSWFEWLNCNVEEEDHEATGGGEAGEGVRAVKEEDSDSLGRGRRGGGGLSKFVYSGGSAGWRGLYASLSVPPSSSSAPQGPCEA